MAKIIGIGEDKSVSMNLNCNQLELWQTPTQISYMCTAGQGDLKGIEARRALEIYKQWVKYEANGYWDNEEDLRDKKDWIKRHIQEIDKVLKDNKFGLKVWVS